MNRLVQVGEEKHDRPEVSGRREGEKRTVFELEVDEIGGGALLLPIAMLSEGVAPPTTGLTLPIMAVVMVTTAAAFAVLFGALHAGMPTATLSRLMLLCPLAVTATGWLAYQHTLSPLQVLGAVLVVVPIVSAYRPAGTARHRATRSVDRLRGRHRITHRASRPHEDATTTRSIAIIRHAEAGSADHATTVVIRLPAAA